MSTSLFCTKIRYKEVKAVLNCTKRYILTASSTSLKEKKPQEPLLRTEFRLQSTSSSSKNVLYVGEEGPKFRS